MYNNNHIKKAKQSKTRHFSMIIIIEWIAHSFKLRFKCCSSIFKKKLQKFSLKCKHKWSKIHRYGLKTIHFPGINSHLKFLDKVENYFKGAWHDPQHHLIIFSNPLWFWYQKFSHIFWLLWWNLMWIFQILMEKSTEMLLGN